MGQIGAENWPIGRRCGLPYDRSRRRSLDAFIRQPSGHHKAWSHGASRGTLGYLINLTPRPFDRPTEFECRCFSRAGRRTSRALVPASRPGQHTTDRPPYRYEGRWLDVANHRHTGHTTGRPVYSYKCRVVREHDPATRLALAPSTHPPFGESDGRNPDRPLFRWVGQSMSSNADTSM